MAHPLTADAPNPAAHWFAVDAAHAPPPPLKRADGEEPMDLRRGCVVRRLGGRPGRGLVVAEPKAGEDVVGVRFGGEMHAELATLEDLVVVARPARVHGPAEPRMRVDVDWVGHVARKCIAYRNVVCSEAMDECVWRSLEGILDTARHSSAPRGEVATILLVQIFAFEGLANLPNEGQKRYVRAAGECEALRAIATAKGPFAGAASSSLRTITDFKINDAKRCALSDDVVAGLDADASRVKCSFCGKVERPDGKDRFDRCGKCKCTNAGAGAARLAALAKKATKPGKDAAPPDDGAMDVDAQ
ncbi:hypothetical protein JL720_17310 [Aureococcus anophagefferens]|nr:hypothetical protein JL720_17310 [Aureococcus anophagefferens]